MPTDPGQLPVFVYGTLRPGQRNYDGFLRGLTAAEQPARLRGAMLYEGPGHPYAVATPDGEIRGELITLGPADYDTVLDALDTLEGCAPGGSGDLYERVERGVSLDGGGTARAWVYLAGGRLSARLRAVGTPVPGGDWPHK